MARLIPEYINPDCKSSAERNLFERFRNELGSEFTVIHSLGLAKSARKIYSEIDFVVVGPAGILTVEVKGGDIKEVRGIWYFTNRYGDVTAKHESPMTQAKNAFFDLRGALRKRFGERSKIAAHVLGFVTLFKDIKFRDESPEWDNRRIYDQEPLATLTLKQVIDDAVAYSLKTLRKLYGSAPTQPLTTAEQDELIAFLRRDFELVRSIGVRVEDAYTDLLTLSPSQYRVLDHFRDAQRLVVTGGAGTGKTLLAFEKARREAARGRKVCLLCFNQLLAAVLSRRIRKEKLEAQVDATTLHAYCLRVITEAGMTQKLGSATGDEALYSERLPEVFPEAFLKLYNEAPYDTLVIDEGQDFRRRPSYFELTDYLVRGGLKNGSWVWFEDNEQSLFGRAADQVDLDRFAPWSTPLLENWRNTGRIAVFNAMASRTVPAKTVGPEGEAVVLKTAQGAKHHLETLDKLIQNLVGGGCKPSDIVILSVVGREKSCLKSLTSLGGFSLCELTTENLSNTRSGLVWTSVYRFKGLESKIVALTDFDVLSSDTNRMARYVGISRANSLLAVVWTQKAQDEFQHLAKDFATKISGH
jgi:hypothetical protein